MKKNILILMVIILSGLESFAQDIHFSQFNESPLLQNPALVGSFNGDQRAIINYKDQWRSVTKPYKTAAVSFDAGILRDKFKSGYLGIGAFIYNDKAGDTKLSTTNINLAISYHIYLNDYSNLAAAIQGGYGQRSMSSANCQWDNQYDGTGYNADLPSGEQNSFNNYGYGDFGAGVLWNYFSSDAGFRNRVIKRANAGISLFHINKPKYSFYETNIEKLNRKFVLSGMMELGVLSNKNFTLIPSLVYYKQGPSQEFNFGTMGRYKVIEDGSGAIKDAAVSLGIFYRWKDAAIAILQLEVSNFAIGVSYDINTSNLKTASSNKGGIEFSLRYVYPNPFHKAISTKPKY
ncbi:MAG: PorP/SprF family type IX secretion system membrane protein [Bacteroidetes bacterium]|nr:PorP/SprF family type IX secretion system membrane protein [Bacteroidota bacterium]